MSDYRRRRFLLDLLFVGGAIVAAAGLASTGESAPETPVAVAETPVSTCTPPPDNVPMPGEVVASPPPPMPGKVAMPPNPAGAPVAHPPQCPPKRKDPFMGKNRPVQKPRHQSNPGEAMPVVRPSPNYAPAGGLPARQQ